MNIFCKTACHAENALKEQPSRKINMLPTASDTTLKISSVQPVDKAYIWLTQHRTKTAISCSFCWKNHPIVCILKMPKPSTLLRLVQIYNNNGTIVKVKTAISNLEKKTKPSGRDKGIYPLHVRSRIVGLGLRCLSILASANADRHNTAGGFITLSGQRYS